jgi:hypothetical protein
MAYWWAGTGLHRRHQDVQSIEPRARTPHGPDTDASIDATDDPALGLSGPAAEEVGRCDLPPRERHPAARRAAGAVSTGVPSYHSFRVPAAIRVRAEDGNSEDLDQSELGRVGWEQQR